MVPKYYKFKNPFFKTILSVFLISLMFLATSPSSALDNTLTTTSVPLELVTTDVESSSEVSTFGEAIDVPGNGTKMQIQAGDLLRLRLRDQLQINLSLHEQAELCLNLSDANPVGPLPANTYQFKNFYRFELNKATQLQASFSMPFSQSELPANVDPEMLHWAYFNTYTNSWEYVYSWLNEYKNAISTQTNHFSTWTILATSDTSQIPTINAQGNGTPIKVKANQQYQIKLQSKFQMNVSFGQDVEFSINETDMVPFTYTFENHYRYGNFWTLETNNSLVDLNATFGFSYDPSLMPCDANQGQFRFYFYNTTRNQWQEANSWTNTTEKMIYAYTNHFSTWTIFVDKIKPMDPKKDSLNYINANGTAMKIENGYAYRFRTQYGFELNVSLGKTAELKMNESNTNQYQNLIQNQKGIGKYITLDLNETGITIQATLAYKVSSTEVPANVDPFKLQFAYFDTATNQWMNQNSWVVDIGSGYYMVYANTTHFSTWTILGSESTQSSSNSIPGFELIVLIIAFVSIPLVKKLRK